MELGSGLPGAARSVAERLRRWRPLGRVPDRRLLAVFVFVNGLVAVAVLALVAMWTGTPFVFPSVGPTAFLLFFTPGADSASPRVTLVGHAIGIACGYGALLATGLAHAPPALAAGVDGPRVIAAGLSIAATGALMILLRAAHPPAGATTLIVSLGIIVRPLHLVLVELSIAALVAQAFVLHRAAGIDYPARPGPPAGRGTPSST